MHTVAGAEAGHELDRFLCARRGVSRKQAKRLLDARVVFVNGRRVWMARHRLRAGDRVEVQSASVRPAAGGTLGVLHEDGRYVIADKPAGLVSNVSPGSAEARLRAQRGEPGLEAVHRLDRDTTGCLLFARTPAAREDAVGVFRERAVEKVYEAIVIGKLEGPPRTVEEPLDGRPARTEVHPLRAGPDASRVRLVLHTGRTHQVRRHLLELGFPLAGDKQYGTGRALPDALREVPRQMLHAASLAFDDPATGRRVAARAPLPADFLEAERRLGLGRRRPGRPVRRGGGR